MGDLALAIKTAGVKVNSKLINKGEGLYRASFTPNNADKYYAYLTFTREGVPGSPHEIRVIDDVQVVADGQGLRQSHVNRQTSFIIDTSAARYVAETYVTITCKF